MNKVVKPILIFAAVPAGIYFFEQLSLDRQIHYLTIAVLIFVFMYFEQAKELEKKYSDKLESLNHELRALMQFICESKVLRDEVKEFQKVDYASHHGSLQTGDGPECNCWFLGDREAILGDRDAFHGLLMKNHPEDYVLEPDGYTEVTNEQFRERIKREVLPIFNRLNEAEPKAFPSDHKAWLLREELDIYAFRRYLTWLIPSLEIATYNVIETPEGKAALADLKAYLNPQNMNRLYSEAI